MYTMDQQFSNFCYLVVLENAHKLIYLDRPTYFPRPTGLPVVLLRF